MTADDRNAIDWERLDQFVRGAGGSTERKALEQWVSADPERRALADAMQTVGRRTSVATNWTDPRHALAKTRRRLGLNPTPGGTP
jgi:hypothetical protein